MSPMPQKMKNYGSFDEWKQDQSATNQQLIEALQQFIQYTAPQLTTTVKWGQGCWTDNDTPKVFIHTEADHVQLGFYNDASLHDPEGLLSGNGKYACFIKVHMLDDINPQLYSDLIKQACA